MMSSEKIKVVCRAGLKKCCFSYDSALENRATEIVGLLVEVGDFQDEAEQSITLADVTGARIELNLGDGHVLYDLPLRLLVNPPRDAVFLPLTLPKISLSKSAIVFPKASDKDRCIIFTFFFKRK